VVILYSAVDRVKKGEESRVQPATKSGGFFILRREVKQTKNLKRKGKNEIFKILKKGEKNEKKKY